MSEDFLDEVAAQRDREAALKVLRLHKGHFTRLLNLYTDAVRDDELWSRKGAGHADDEPAIQQELDEAREALYNYVFKGTSMRRAQR